MMRPAIATFPRDGSCQPVVVFGNEVVTALIMISPSLIAAIGIFRMLQVPQGAAARDGRNGRKVIRRGRRTGGPFQCPRVPRVVTGPVSLEIGNYEVCYKHENRDRLNERADADKQVQSVPAAARLVGVDTAQHTQQTGNVHEVE